MRKIIITGSMLILALSALMAQESFLPLLEEIERNSTTLEALRQNAEAGKLESKTGIYLENPEVGFNYLWGDPSVIGNRTDFSVMQSFDFPSAYKYRGNIADLRTMQAELGFRAQRAAILYEARLVCVDLVYFNALIRENAVRLEYARSLAAAIEKMYEQGKVSILEWNKARLNLSNAINDNALLEAEADVLRSELTRLNGGVEIKMESVDYPALSLTDNFDQWYEEVIGAIPEMQFLEKQAVISENEEKLKRAMSLPKFSAGYMSEKVVGEKYQGLSVGMSIPLFENKNTVKAARARRTADLAMVEDSRLQFYQGLKNQYDKVQGLSQAAKGYASSLLYANNSELLRKAYEMGEISLIEYLVELQFYYDTYVKALEAKREMHKAFAALEKWR
ncbi:MAG TPA: TolC family protein [Bacteroidales bacterium]|nr:TolC family protein [Bacteroidales bacterium]